MSVLCYLLILKHNKLIAFNKNMIANTNTFVFFPYSISSLLLNAILVIKEGKTNTKMMKRKLLRLAQKLSNTIGKEKIYI